MNVGKLFKPTCYHKNVAKKISIEFSIEFVKL